MSAHSRRSNPHGIPAARFTTAPTGTRHREMLARTDTCRIRPILTAGATS